MANITVSTSPSNVQVNATTNTIAVTTSTSNVVIGDNKILSNSVIREALSVTDAGGDGSLVYNNTSGVFTYTGISDLQIRSKLSATSPIAYDNTSGNISLLGNANITTSANVSASHFLGNGSQLTGVTTMTNADVQTFLETNGMDFTTNVSISGANQNWNGNVYIENSSTPQQLSLFGTPGSTIMSWTGNLLGGNSSSNITAGGKITAGSFHGGLTGDVTGNVVGNVTGSPSSLAGLNTDDLAQGSTNQYFSTSLANAAIIDALSSFTSNISSTKTITGGRVTINPTTGVTQNAELVFGEVNSGESGAIIFNGNAMTYPHDIKSFGASDLRFTQGGNNSSTHFTLSRTGAGSGPGHLLATIAGDMVVGGAANINGVATLTDALNSNSNITTTANISGANVIGTYLHGDGSNISGIAGDIAGVTAGVGLSGGGTSGTVTVNLDPTITTATPSGNGSLAYDNSSGVFTFAPADVPNNTDELSEGSTNQYFTTARANSAITAYTGALANLTGNITTTANISGGNLLTDHVISASGQPLQLKGQTDGIELDKTVSSAEARIVDLNTTGYSVAQGDFHTSDVTTSNTPAILLQASAASGQNTMTVTNLFGSAFLWGGRQQSASAFANYITTAAAGGAGGTSFATALTAQAANSTLKGWYWFDSATSSTTSVLPATAFVTGMSGNTITFSENFTSAVSLGGSGFSGILQPGAFSTTQEIAMTVQADLSNTSAPYLQSLPRLNKYSLPETLSNTQLDAVSYGSSTVDLANATLRHIADLETGSESALRTPRALLIGANATPDLLSIGTADVSPPPTTLGITVENDGLTSYPTGNPQTKFLMNQFKDGSLSGSYPDWTEFSGQSGNTTVDMQYLAAPLFNFKLIGGDKLDKVTLKTTDVLGRIAWNGLSGSLSGGLDLFHPPASITVRAPGTGTPANLTLANTDMHFQSTYSTSFRNGSDATIGTIPRTFLSSSEGNTVIAAKTDGKITLRPVRDYGDTGDTDSFVENRFAHELHEFHEFLGAGFLGTKEGTLVEIQPKSGSTQASTSDFNYDSSGDSTLRLSSHHANSAVKAQWDITNDESESTLIVRDHTNSATKLEFSALRTEFSTSAKLKNYTTAQINALSSPEAGDMVFNTTLGQVCVYDGSAWQKITQATM